MRYVIFKKAGESGDVAINSEMVMRIEGGTGPFTDIYFGQHRVAVEGSLSEIVNKLCGEEGINASVSRPVQTEPMCGAISGK